MRTLLLIQWLTRDSIYHFFINYEKLEFIYLLVKSK